MKRDVRTLLLCKVNPYAIRDAKENKEVIDYSSIYDKIYSGPLSDGDRYIALGNFDSFCIYKPMNSEKSDWLEAIYSDRQTISSKLEPAISYHPIHLVSYSKKDLFWKKQNRFPFCLATLVYGLSEDDHNKTIDFEKEVIQFINKQCPDETHIAFVAYHAINICDAVVLWFTDDISYALRQAASINQAGIARKTYTMVGFRMDDGKPQNLGQLILSNSIFHIRIQGSIRDHKEAQGFFLREDCTIKEKLSAANKGYVDYFANCVFGKDDFTVLLPNLTGKQLACLINCLMENSISISEACWEVHTEFLLEANYNYISPPNGRPHILSSEYRKFLNLFDKYLQYHIDINDGDISWAPAYLELLNVHTNIDRHPILHAPSFLLYNFIRIANSYFLNASMDKQYEYVLQVSKENIQSIIRNWSQLTDQITRADDLVFHGVGSSLSIYNTIPECILDFYHSFLRCFVNTILSADAKRKPEGFSYAFLLVPEQSQRVRISEMFDLDKLYATLQQDELCACADACNNCDNLSKCWRNKLWPQEQVYLVEFPAKLIYYPKSFLIPIIHECFHYFGDTFRLRTVRAQYFTHIIAFTLLHKLHLDASYFNAIRKNVTDHLKIERPLELHLKDTGYELLYKLSVLFEKELDDLGIDVPDPYYLKSRDTVSAWNQLAVQLRSEESSQHNTFWSQCIEMWCSFFKECYADLMTMLSLKLSPNEYIFEFTSDSISFFSDDLISQNASVVGQRIALVISAYAFDKNAEYSSQTILASAGYNAIQKSGLDDSIKKCASNSMIAMLCNDAPPLSYSKNNIEYLQPPHLLKFVLYYLFDVKNKFNTTQIVELDKRREEFTDLFSNGNLFSESFYKVIKNNHDQIKHSSQGNHVV